jgi:hypothetical protein
MSNRAVRQALWWLCLFVAPLVLLAIELFHPAGFTQEPGMYQYLSQPQPFDPQFHALAYPGPHWWFTLHMIQTPLVALVAIGLWLMAGRLEDGDGPAAVALAWLGRVAAFVFLVFYTSLDAIGGSGLGRAILNTERLATSVPPQLTPEQLEGAILVLNTNWVDPWVGGVGSFISLTGSWAAFVAALLVALALLAGKKAPWPAALLLVGFGWELQMSHTMPHGPIAFGLLLVAAAWIWWWDRRRAARAAAG